MYNIPSNVRVLLRDGAEQNFLLKFKSGETFFASDGAFTNKGISITDYYTTEDNITFGGTPSSVMEAELLNPEEMLSGFAFGETDAYIGVKTAHGASAFTGRGYISIAGEEYIATANGLSDGNGGYWLSGIDVLSIISDGEYIYCYDGTADLIRYKLSDGTHDSVPASTAMQYIMASYSGKKSYIMSGAGMGMVWTPEYFESWYFIPVGTFLVERPAKVKTEVVSLSECYDRMQYFDVDAAEFLAGLTYPKTAGQLLSALCAYVGVPLFTTTFTHSDKNFTSSPFTGNAVSCRDILGYIASLGRACARMDRAGRVILVPVSNSIAENISDTNIALGSIDIAEYETEPVSGVLLKSVNGSSLSYGYSGVADNPYMILGNPLIDSIDTNDLAAYRNLMTYTPMILSVITADPSVDVGDLCVVTYKSVTYTIPLLARDMSWNNRLSATYYATGDKKRPYDPDYTEYNANAVPTMTQETIFNRLTNGGEVQGIYLHDGKIYINADWIQAGTLVGRAINNGNGTFSVDANGRLIATNAKISGEITGGDIVIQGTGDVVNPTQSDYVEWGIYLGTQDMYESSGMEYKYLKLRSGFYDSSFSNTDEEEINIKPTGIDIGTGDTGHEVNIKNKTNIRRPLDVYGDHIAVSGDASGAIVKAQIVNRAAVSLKVDYSTKYRGLYDETRNEWLAFYNDAESRFEVRNVYAYGGIDTGGTISVATEAGSGNAARVVARQGTTGIELQTGAQGANRGLLDYGVGWLFYFNGTKLIATKDLDVQGNLSVTGTMQNGQGDLKATGTRTAVAPSAVAATSGTWTSTGSIQLPAGKYVLVGFGQFESNATGYRRLVLSTSGTGGSPINVSMDVTQAAVSGAVTDMQVSAVHSFSSDTTVYLNAYQNSGTALTVTGRIYAMRIA